MFLFFIDCHSVQCLNFVLVVGFFGLVVFHMSFVIPLYRICTVFTNLVMFRKTEVPFSRPGKFGEN